MSVWLCIPSARPVAEVNARMDKWRKMGYKIGLWRDHPQGCRSEAPVCDHFCCSMTYPGYATVVNRLISIVLHIDPACDWIVTGGDDVDPDLSKTADQIARECSALFGHKFYPDHLPVEREGPLSTFGVMQPTGDRWGDKQGAYIDRVAGSPWIGREFARRMYGGKGPYFDGWQHMGVDEELQAVATKLGVFWQRPDLIHYHDHWGRPKAGQRLGHRDNMPKFLEQANSPEVWTAYKKLFAERQAEGVPGHEPIA